MARNLRYEPDADSPPASASQAAAMLGRKGGQATSRAKAAAARENGKKGGWPKGRKRKP